MHIDKRIEAFNLLLPGKTIREIAKELKISRSFVERWSFIDFWVYERQQGLVQKNAHCKRISP